MMDASRDERLKLSIDTNVKWGARLSSSSLTAGLSVASELLCAPDHVSVIGEVDFAKSPLTGRFHHGGLGWCGSDVSQFRVGLAWHLRGRAAGFLAAFIAANRWPGRKRPCDGSKCTQSLFGAQEEAFSGEGRHCADGVNGN